ncbi:hypothetical protein SRHO_G00170070 [Serrasalmus rhombeus]
MPLQPVGPALPRSRKVNHPEFISQEKTGFFLVIIRQGRRPWQTAYISITLTQPTSHIHAKAVRSHSSSYPSRHGCIDTPLPVITTAYAESPALQNRLQGCTDTSQARKSPYPASFSPTEQLLPCQLHTSLRNGHCKGRAVKSSTLLHVPSPQRPMPRPMAHMKSN